MGIQGVITMSTTDEATTVQVSRSTHRRLHEMKGYRQSFDDLIDEMADVYENQG